MGIGSRLVKMQRWGLAAGTAFVLLVTAWVSAAGPVGIFRRQDRTPTADSRIGRRDEFQEWSNVPPPITRIGRQAQPNELLVTLIVWGLRLTVLGIGLWVLFLLARELLRRRADRLEDEDAPAPIDTLPEVLLHRAKTRMAELAAGAPTDAIVACWVRLEAEVAAAGLRPDETRTSAETASAVLTHYDVDPAALEELAALFREARFSEHQLGEEHRARAADALTALHVDLARAAARQALATAPHRVRTVGP